MNDVKKGQNNQEGQERSSEVSLQSVLSSQELRELSKLNTRKLVFDLALNFTSFFLTPWLFRILPLPFGIVFCSLLNLRMFSANAQIIHMGDHGALSRSRKLNSLAGNLCSYFSGFTLEGHREAHLRHHRFLNSSNDPDLIWASPNKARNQVYSAWIHDLVGVSALKRFMQYSQGEQSSFHVKPWRSLEVKKVFEAFRHIFPVMVTQALIFAYYSCVIHPIAYFGLYLLPLSTLYPAVIRLRAAAEHLPDTPCESDAVEKIQVTRTIRTNWLGRFIIAPLAIEYHAEHHHFLQVPYYNLKELSKRLESRGYKFKVAQGYLRFILQKT